MKSKLKAEAREVAQECSKADWDGYDAEPVTEAAVADICLLIDALPEGIEKPDVVPEPTGCICLEWQGDEQALILNLEPAKVGCAFLSGEHREARSDKFDGGLSSRVKEILLKRFKL